MGLFDDVVETVTKPIRSVTKAAGKTLAGVFEDTTQPFLKPIDNLLDSLAPRFRIQGEVGGSVGASISGSTTHNIVFPQIPGATGPRAALGDVTGGLLSDLAFDSAQLQKAETELDFLESAMRKGVYPHRDDAFFLGASIVLTNQITAVPAAAWIQIVVEDYDSAKIFAEFALPISKAKVTQTINDANVRYGKDQIDSQMKAVLLEQSEKAQLSLPRQQLTKVRVRVSALDGNGKAVDAGFNGLEEITLWVERHNTGFTDILHRFSCEEPKRAFQVSLPLDRREFMSAGTTHEMGGINTDTGGLARSADALRQAQQIASESAEGPVDASADKATGIDQLSQLLFQRVNKAERVRESLWAARRSLQRVRSAEGVFDFRLRYKLRVANQGTTPRTIQRLAFDNKASRSGTVAGVWDLEQIDLPATSVFEVTVYPLYSTDDMVSDADLTMTDSKPHTSFSLWAGLGLHDSLLQSRSVASKNEGQPDSAALQWSIRDCCRSHES